MAAASVGWLVNDGARLTPAVSAQPSAQQRPTIVRRPWGTMPTGEQVWAYTLTNDRGNRLTVITLGATITSLVVPDQNGQKDDVVLGVTSVKKYLTQSPYFGAIVGRYANRIANGRFWLDGTSFTLKRNNGPNHLHGGVIGFDKKLWTARQVQNDSGAAVRLSLMSADGEEGYPGRLELSVRYLWTNDDRLVIDYTATTTKTTVVNVSQHSYFNLGGRSQRDILGTQLMIAADRYTPVDSTLIPTGELASLDGTPLDFRTATAIGARIDTPHQQLLFGKGYDHNYVLQGAAGTLRRAAVAYEPSSGRTMEVWTTEPGIQFYSGNFLDGTISGKDGRKYRQRAGFCLETQHFPDSPNHPHFPSTILQPGETLSSRTIYAFGSRR